MGKILFIGESWMFEKTEYKGVDSFTVSGYEVATQWIEAAVEAAGYEFVHIPAHEVDQKFPRDLTGLKEYDAVLVSDVGYNTFKLSNQTFHQCKQDIDKLQMIRRYVEEGGSYGMIGGYMTFQGFEGKGKYHGSEIEELLPVYISATDDRVEVPEGIEITLKPDSHEILKGLPEKWPPILGYNRLTAKEDAIVPVTYEDDPMIVLGQYGKGKTLAFATDCSPHWASPAFCDWEYYPVLWRNILEWLCG